MVHHPSFLRIATAWAAALAVSSGLALGCASASAFAPAIGVLGEPLNAASGVVEFAAGGAHPVDVVPGADGSVWVALSSDKKIVQLDRSGTVVRSVSLTGSPSSLAVDGDGGVWATEPAENSIAHVTLSPLAREILLPSPKALPTQIYDSGDIVLIAESGAGKLGRFTESTGTFVELGFTGTSSPIVVGNMAVRTWVIDDKGSAYSVDGNGEHPIVLGSTGLQKALQWLDFDGGTVSGIAFSASKVVKVSQSSTSFQVNEVIAGRGDLVGVAYRGGAIWFADAGTNSIGWVVGSEKAEYPMPTVDAGLAGMAITEGRYIWSAEQKAGKVVRIDSASPRVERIGGADRYEVAANVSRAGDYSAGDRTVFVASGEAFPDALSVGPIAAANVAPLLLTGRAALPTTTRGELIRLAPRRVIVVGGPASVTSVVLDSIKAAVPGVAVERIGGADRYAVSRALLTGDLARPHWPILYVANGQNFPDALSSTAAAARLHAGILLVDGAAATLSAEEMSLVRELAGSGTSIKIAGGFNSVSVGIEDQIRSVATVQRFGGADRYEVSQAIVRDAFGTSRLNFVYLASGSPFPDALAGGVGAGLKGAPVLLVHPDCVPQGVLDIFPGDSARRVTLYGGPLTLNGEVEKLVACR